jgi:hypothetical protein
MTELTQVKLKELLHYDPETGLWTWIKRRSGVTQGSAGTARFDDRRQIRVLGKFYLASRLAWLYMTGEWPGEIDHINRDKGDDRWDNLREVNHSQNMLNRDWSERSGSMRGIQKDGNQWKVMIRNMYFGHFPYLDDAKAIRDLALWYGEARHTTLEIPA